MSTRISPGRIGRWSASHPWRALMIWFAFVAGCVAIGAATGTSTLSDGAVGDSARGNAVMNQQGLWGPPREYAYLHSSAQVSSDPGFAAAVRDVERRITALGLQVSATTSADRHSVLVSVTPRQPASPATASDLLAVPERIRAVQRAHPGLTIAETGDISANDAQTRIVNGNLNRVELLAIPVTLLVLLLAFGSLVAALVPLLLGLTAVAAGLGLLGPVSHLFPVQDSAKTVILLIGLAVGVDYALFYVARFRQEQRSGAARPRALQTTFRTSGRTVVISGSIVALAVTGMFIPGLKVLNGIAAGTIAVIACAVVGSVTVLPAVLALLGPKIDAGRIRLPHRLRGPAGRFWPSLTGRVLCRPVAAACLATAQDIDFTGQVHGGLPWAIAFVLVLAFGLLLAAFRSVIVALTAVVLNLLSVAAAYGVLVLVFQHRWAEPVLHFHSNGTITSWLPLFLFVILFGLSMDYHVFILSRVQEAVTGGEPTRLAVRHSITRTAGVITAAALVMVCVFALFGTLSSLDLKQAGVGLAAAVLIDATVIRAVLLPATMTMLGERNWYLPRWLTWLPWLGLGAPAAGEQAASQAAAAADYQETRT